MLEADEIEKYDELRDIVARLRAPDGCPWDREQTHASLRPYVIEEAYEVLATLDDGDLRGLPEELGDLLFQVLIHTQLAEEAGEFTMARRPRRPGRQAGAAPPPRLRRRAARDRGRGLGAVGRAEAGRARAEATSRRCGHPAGAAGALARPGAAASRRERGLRLARPPRRARQADEELDELAARARRKSRSRSSATSCSTSPTTPATSSIDAEEALRLAANKFRRRFESVEAQVEGCRSR